MFISMQFYMMTMYDEIWDGPLEQLQFFSTTEYGIKTISTYIPEEFFRDVKENRADDILLILEQQCSPLFNKFGQNAASSPVTLWENVFGYLFGISLLFLKTPVLKNKPSKLTLLQDERYFGTIPHPQIILLLI